MQAATLEGMAASFFRVSKKFVFLPIHYPRNNVRGFLRILHKFIALIKVRLKLYKK